MSARLRDSAIVIKVMKMPIARLLIIQQVKCKTYVRMSHLYVVVSFRLAQ